jgi:hypothetical protein
MELREFISQTIQDISLGISDAKDTLNNQVGGMAIAPVTVNMYKQPNYPAEKIEFDISVTTSNDSTSKKGGGVKISVIRIDADKESNLSTAATNRIKFSVPFFPQQIKARQEEAK